MKAHMYTSEIESQPKQILLGSKNPDNWRVLVQFRGEVKKAITDRDMIDIANFINRTVELRMNPQKLVTAGHGLILPGINA